MAIAAVVGALVFLQVKFNIFGRAERYHGSMGRSSWLVQRSVWAIGQVVSGFVSGCSRLLQ